MVQTDVASLIHSPHFLSGILQGCLARTRLLPTHQGFCRVFLRDYLPRQSVAQLKLDLLMNQVSPVQSGPVWLVKTS